MSTERIYLVTYDISDAKRLRNIHKLMRGYGEWLQYSIFQCQLNDIAHAELIADLDLLINHNMDHVLLFDLGKTHTVKPKITSLGKPYLTPDKSPIII